VEEEDAHMARIAADRIEELKHNVSILHLCADRGIELTRQGTDDYIGRCPLPGHEDEKPSFIVTPRKNLWHCMGCDKGGSIIDLVMQLDGLAFRGAVGKLLASNGLVHLGASPAAAEAKEPAATIRPERAAQLLERAVTVYAANYTESPEAKAYLEARGIADAGLADRHRIGYSTGRLNEILPSGGNLRRDLKAIGILSIPGSEHFAGCLVVPVLDIDGNITTLYGRVAEEGAKKHVFLPGRPTGLWNAPVIKTHSELIVVESVLDALSVEVAGFDNVVAVHGTNGLGDADLEEMRRNGVGKLVLLFDGDQAGTQAVERLKKKDLCGITVETRSLPSRHDPNSYLIEFGAAKLADFLSASPESPTPAEPARPSHGPGPGQGRAGGQGDSANSSALRTPNSALLFTYGLRTYQVLGLEKGARKLKATVRVEHAGKLHVDTLDFYSARSRRLLAQDLCRLFEECPETVEADITRLLKALETAEPQPDAPVAAPDPAGALSAGDRREAERFGRSARLIERILADYETCGLVGEEANKLLCYVAAVSRKMDEPLSVLVLSSSGAGKTALQDTTLAFVPPEDLVKLTSLSGKALFYKDRLSLKHKVLALEEGDGAEEATYAIRNLISAGELVIESTIKDLATGRLTTMDNRVEGPTSVFITTTDPETDPETKSRFFVTSIDESREQTRRILDFQRRRQTLDGLTGDMALDAILRRHRNFQRLLNPVAVVNPYARRLSYGDDRLQGRRDQPKYLNLIKAVAFLRQMQKDIRHTDRNAAAPRGEGQQGAYIVVDIADIRIANRLAHEILGKSLDELSRPGRALLMLLDEMVEKRTTQLKEENGQGLARCSVRLTRREIREYTGWAHTRVHRYLKELVELEYVLIDSGRNGTVCRYRLAYEGQGKDGSKFCLGLSDPNTLESEKDD
jgi:DNA primase catalytic core